MFIWEYSLIMDSITRSLNMVSEKRCLKRQYFVGTFLPIILIILLLLKMLIGKHHQNIRVFINFSK